MAKVIRALARAGFVNSQVGKGGGHSLRRNAVNISLLDIVNATDNVKNSNLLNCVMGFDVCSDRNPCTLHDIWVEAAKKMREELAQTTLQDVAGLMKKLKPKHRAAGTLSHRVRAVFG